MALIKAVKIKAVILLLSWLVIFAHGIIPHSHHYEGFQGCKELLHNSFSCSSDEDGSLKFENERTDLQVCHLSNSPFHNLNPEIFFAYSSRDMNFVPCCLAEEIITDNNYSFISDHLKGATFLRPPPTL